jgi:hypothetical protein
MNGEGDLQTFSQELVTVGVAFYERTIGPEVVVAYWEALKGYRVDQLVAALRKHVCSTGRCRFFPKPGDLIELIDGSSVAAAAQMWQQVDEKIRSSGRYVSVCFEDPVTAQVIEEMGGWTSVCSSETERDHDFKRQEFVKRYEQVRGLDARPAMKSAGLLERSGGKLGAASTVKIRGKPGELGAIERRD